MCWVKKAVLWTLSVSTCMVCEYISVSTYNQGWDVFDFSFTLQPEVYSFLLLLLLVVLWYAFFFLFLLGLGVFTE